MLEFTFTLISKITIEINVFSLNHYISYLLLCIMISFLIHRQNTCCAHNILQFADSSLVMKRMIRMYVLCTGDSRAYCCVTVTSQWPGQLARNFLMRPYDGERKLKRQRPMWLNRAPWSDLELSGKILGQQQMWESKPSQSSKAISFCPSPYCHLRAFAFVFVTSPHLYFFQLLPRLFSSPDTPFFFHFAIFPPSLIFLHSILTFFLPWTAVTQADRHYRKH